jgi:hypothetical protein
MEKLLEIRSTPEAQEFRGWVADLDKFSDAEIRDRFAGFNSKVGLAVQTISGKVLRLLATSLVGFVPPPLGLAAGLVASGLDAFIWDAFFKRSGVAAFVNELYPSIFKSG